RLQRLKSPLGIRVPLLDPEKFLNRSAPIVNLFLSKIGALAWLSVLVFAFAVLAVNWNALIGNAADRLLSLENVLLTALVYPVVKTIHEFAHAYTVKKYGGEVHEMGIMFLVFFPVPYVDASSASVFTSKYQRMLVGAAGILAEVFMASIAMIVWALAEEGALRAVAFNTMVIAGVSTVLFNGNPLLKFDAYYVLADYLEIPNLGHRANQHVGYLAQRWLFRIPASTRVASFAEGCWLAAYSILSYFYRLFVMVAIAVFIAQQYLFVGVLLAFWSIYTSLILPTGKLLIMPFTHGLLKEHQMRIITISALILAGVAYLLGGVSVPLDTYSQGVFTPAEKTHLRANEGGFVKEIAAKSQTWVEQGQPLILLEEPLLSAQVAVLAANVKEHEARYQAESQNRAAAEIQRSLLAFSEKEFAEAHSRQQKLTVFANHGGLLVLPDSESLIGTYINRGDTLGYVLDPQALPVTALVSEDEIDDLRRGTQQIEVRLASSPERVFSADIQRIYPASTNKLPSEVLSTEGGGLFAVDPSSGQELTAYRRFYQVSLHVEGLIPEHLNERVHIVFRHDPEPIVYRWWRSI
ncbi:MAG: efflux RND transporter periplasmic adaptor subunit, partial [Pontibacterium sp.]